MQDISTLEFIISNEGRIKIDPPVLERFRPYIQNNAKSFEGGGVLLGRLIKETKDIVIDKITVPMIGDKRSRFSFYRGGKMHQRIVDREWDKSEGTCNYLGEWHTHPEKFPSPSSQDISDWKRKLKQDFYSTRYLYFIIVGTKEIGMWEGDRRTLKIKKLNKP
jgi:integrative and conjugative element protein (TIGR02256 family)